MSLVLHVRNGDRILLENSNTKEKIVVTILERRVKIDCKDEWKIYRQGVLEKIAAQKNCSVNELISLYFVTDLNNTIARK